MTIEAESMTQPPTQAEVNREKQRFLNLVEKINKLEEAVDTFENEYGSIDKNTDWLVRLKTMRNEIEEVHQTFEPSINDKRAEYETKVEQSLNHYDKFIEEKKQEVQGCVDEIEDIKEEINTANNLIDVNKESVKNIASECENQKQQIDAFQEKIAKILFSAEKALTSATSAGLAKEFEKQKNALKKKEFRWVLALVASLVLALVLTYFRLTALQELMAADKSVTAFVFVLNCLISIAAIGAPVWFAWLATKQVGYCFRLSEDYAFKAATAGSFEGFRREIESLSVDEENDSNDQLRLKLLTTVLTRLDEQPLRYVDSKVHGSPFHEALLNRLMTKAEVKKSE